MMKAAPPPASTKRSRHPQVSSGRNTAANSEESDSEWQRNSPRCRARSACGSDLRRRSKLEPIHSKDTSQLPVTPDRKFCFPLPFKYLTANYPITTPAAPYRICYSDQEI